MIFEIVAAIIVAVLHFTGLYPIDGVLEGIGIWFIASWGVRGGIGWMMPVLMLEQHGSKGLETGQRNAGIEWMLATAAAGLIFGWIGAGVLIGSGVLYLLLGMIVMKLGADRVRAVYREEQRTGRAS